MYNIHDSTVYLYFFIILANKVACREGSDGQEHINEIGFSLEPSASEVLEGAALHVLTSLLRTPVKQQH